MRSAAALLLLAALTMPLASSNAQRPAAPVAATAAVMSADARLVAAQAGWMLRVWERESGKLRATIDNHPSFFRGAIAEGVLAGISAEKPVVWRGPDFAQRVPMRNLPKVTTYGRVFLSSEGKLLGALYPKAGDARDPDSFGIWETKSGNLIGAVNWEQGCRVHGLVFGRGGLLVAFGDEPSKRALLRLYRVHGRGRPKELLAWSSSNQTATFSAALSPDGKRLALGAGERIVLLDVSTTRQLGSVPTNGARQLFPRSLQSAVVQIPGAHQLSFSADSRRLAVLHGFGVAGVAIWELTPGAREPMRPVTWVRRPVGGGSFRQIAWDASGALHLITASYSPAVFAHVARGDRFTVERSLTP